MKRIPKRLRFLMYEAEKQLLQQLNLPSEEYEKRVQALARKLKL